MASKNTEESPEDILYIRNEEGGVHDVTRAFADANLYETTNSGKRFLLHGFEIITEAEAKKANPQIFGIPDPSITYTAAERKDQSERREFEKQAAEENDAAKSGKPAPADAPAAPAA